MDFDGSKATERILFALDGVEYAIDLNDAHDANGMKYLPGPDTGRSIRTAADRRSAMSSSTTQAMNGCEVPATQQATPFGPPPPNPASCSRRRRHPWRRNNCPNRRPHREGGSQPQHPPRTKMGPRGGPSVNSLCTLGGPQAPEQGEHVPEVGLEPGSSP
ncbi:Lsr2 dimerization domain-containing protein [Arthrobacter sp. PsM3]|uniref:Lsr2 dimerization domain-containing protein n=1 Tax=Arthrobacter sp. PsM3 TaxID=3030531 RepID=UPI003F880CCC